MSGYSGHNTTGRGNEIAASRTRHNSFSSGSNNNAYPLNNEGVGEYRDVVKNTIYRLNKKAGNEWQKAHDNAAKMAVYPKATFKYNANRQKFEGKSTNTTTTKKKRKTVKKRLVKINNNNNNKTNKKNNKKKNNKKNATKKINESRMGGGRRHKTRRKRRKRRKRRGRMNRK